MIFCVVLLEEKRMASRTLYIMPDNISEIIDKTGVLKNTPIDGRPYKIRVRYHGINFSTRKKLIKYLQKSGFSQVGNTTLWTFVPASPEKTSLLD
jgi:hypothetical protein